MWLCHCAGPVTCGCVTVQILRVDPNGRSLPQFIHEEVVQPLGVDLCWGKGLGCPNGAKDVFTTVEPSVWRSIGAVMGDSIPSMLPSKLVKALYANPPSIMNVPMLGKAAYSFTGLSIKEFGKLHESRVDHLDLTSLNGRSSAASMAKVAQLMANKGALGPTRLLSKETALLASTMDADSKQLCALLGSNTTFTRGGFGKSLFDAIPGNKFNFSANFTGWAGLGGSLMVWDPERKLAIGFAGRGLINLAYYKHTGAVLELLDGILEEIDGRSH